MTQTRLDQFVLVIVILSNMVLCTVLAVTLRTTPADVSEQLTAIVVDLNETHAGIRDELNEIKLVMKSRGEWIEGVDATLTERTKDRVFKSQVIEWQSQFSKMNPGVKVPALPIYEPPK